MKIEGKTIEEKLAEIKEKMNKAEEDSDEIAIRNLLADTGDVYLEEGMNEKHREFYNKAYEKAVGASKKLDYLIVILYSYFNNDMIEEFCELFPKCQALNKEDGDWEKKNKLNIYEGIIMLLHRDFKSAASLFISVINTFNAEEIMPFATLVTYSSLLGIISLKRSEFKEKVINSSEVLGVYLENQLLSEFIDSIYTGKYYRVFPLLIDVNEKILAKDKFLSIHRSQFIRKLRSLIFSQYLQSYKTVKLDRMAADFGVSAKFLDYELYLLISTDELACKIDKVNKVVESFHPDSEYMQFKSLIKDGDKLIERMHKVAKQIQA